ncbi:nucleotide exchange factor GrpE, partial [Nakamurella silvestris]
MHHDHRDPAKGGGVATALRTGLVSGMISAHDLAQGPTATAVRRQLERTLHQAGVERIEVAVGEPFDVDLHSVAGTEPTADQALSRCVAREVRPGWLWGG